MQGEEAATQLHARRILRPATRGRSQEMPEEHDSTRGYPDDDRSADAITTLLVDYLDRSKLDWSKVLEKACRAHPE